MTREDQIRSMLAKRPSRAACASAIAGCLIGGFCLTLSWLVSPGPAYVASLLQPHAMACVPIVAHISPY